jgi:putative chitinase
MHFDRQVFFDEVRPMFGGELNQDQVDGMGFILTAWEKEPQSDDLRWLAYALATTKHETASEMMPICEYGKGEGMSYGNPDPTTGETYYGRGFVQLTWDTNYQRADTELALAGDASCYWHADNALDPITAARVMFYGMVQGWFRTHDDGEPETLARYFNEVTDDPYMAREIINGDKHYTPDWADGAKIGDIIADYHINFLGALITSKREEDDEKVVFQLTIRGKGPFVIEVKREGTDV